MRWICAGCTLVRAAALIVLAFASAYWMVLLFAVLQGLSWGMRGPLMAAIRADYFGSASFGTITGVSSIDRKSTRLNSSHDQISYAVFCLKKKKNKNI